MSSPNFFVPKTYNSRLRLRTRYALLLFVPFLLFVGPSTSVVNVPFDVPVYIEVPVDSPIPTVQPTIEPTLVPSIRVTPEYPTRVSGVTVHCSGFHHVTLPDIRAFVSLTKIEHDLHTYTLHYRANVISVKTDPVVFSCGSLTLSSHIYYTCPTVPSYNSGTGAIISKIDYLGGYNFTSTCPPDTSLIRYALNPSLPSTVSCTRYSGSYDNILSTCLTTEPLSTGVIGVRYSLSYSGSPCTPDSHPLYTTGIMIDRLNSMIDPRCGFRHSYSCLVEGTCELLSDRTQCYYDSVLSKFIISGEVSFSEPVWTVTERNDLVKSVGTVYFWGCSF